MLTGYGIRDLDQFTNFFMTDISRLQRCVSDVEKQRGERTSFLCGNLLL